MKWIKMNYRHSLWRLGYKWYATWPYSHWASSRRARELHKLLSKHYGPSQTEISEPSLPDGRPQRFFNDLGYELNKNWYVDQNKRRIYVTEEVLTWTKLSGDID